MLTKFNNRSKQVLPSLLLNTTAVYTIEKDNKLKEIDFSLTATTAYVDLGLETKQPLSAVLTDTTASFTTAQEAKLAGIAPAATANAADASLRDRATHTGTQVAATVSDFSEAVDDRVAALLVAGTNVTLTYNDAAGTLTIAATGGSGAGPQTVMVDFTSPSRGRFFDVPLFGATVGQKVVATMSLAMPIGVAEDELEMEPLVAYGRIDIADQVRLFVAPAWAQGWAFGQRNINMVVG
jgi:hypothetical protein